MNDIVARLRASVTQCRAVDRSELLAEAHAEIARLRLTDAEREAVEQAIDAANGMGQAEPWTMRTLRGLLERLK